MIKNRRDTKLILNFKNKKKVFKVKYKNFCRKFKVKEIIKLSKFEFKNLEKRYLKKSFNHYNLHNSVHKKNKNYLIIKILRKGMSQKTKHIQPLLDYKKFYLVKCLQIKNNIKYNKLSSSDFRNNILSVNNADNLKVNILKKYQTTLRHITKKEKLNLGVGITKLKVLKKYENS